MGSMEAAVVFGLVLLYLVIILWPVARICRRTGHSPWLAILAIIPVANVILLWFIALSRWSPAQASGTAIVP
jgi:hypothetical protein